MNVSKLLRLELAPQRPFLNIQPFTASQKIRSQIHKYYWLQYVNLLQYHPFRKQFYIPLNKYNNHSIPRCTAFQKNSRADGLIQSTSKESSSSSQHTHPFNVAVNPTPLPHTHTYPPTTVISFSWMQLLVIFGFTLSTVSTAISLSILFLLPLIKSAQKATETTDEAAKDMQIAAKEMEKTALMFQQDLPLTMQDVQRTSEEWELVGKQVNFLVSQVSRPLKPKERAEAVERATEWVGDVAGTTTASLSKIVAADSKALANSLWSSINQFRQQIGWSGLSSEAAAEAKRVIDIGRQQQEARSWIASWRGRTGPAARAAASIAAAQRAQDETDLERVKEMSLLLKQSVAGREDYEDLPKEQQSAVEAVLAALERAQRAAQEAAASSSALELAIEQAESTGALSSSDEEDQFENNDDLAGGDNDSDGVNTSGGDKSNSNGGSAGDVKDRIDSSEKGTES